MSKLSSAHPLLVGAYVAGQTGAPNLVAPLLVNLGFCRISFWYAVDQVLVFPGRAVTATVESLKKAELNCCSLQMDDLLMMMC
jgi:hypothetical protein